MKKVYIEVQVKNQVQQTIRDTFAGVNQSIHPIPFRYPVTQLRLPAEARAGDFNIFLTQNKGKGPPGRTRSPGKARGHPPECWEDIPENNAGPPQGVPLSSRREGPGMSSLPNPIVCQNQIISYKKQNLIFYKHLIFIIMKKQILFLALFTLALIFAGTSAYGQVQLNQAVTATNPIDPLTCAGTPIPLHPFAGVAYTYTMDGTTGVEDADQWTWFATKDPNFIVNGVLNTANALTVASGALLATSANYGTPGATNSVTITWSPEILAATEYQGDATAAGTPAAPSPTFVVGFATGVNCADNIQVYEINPRFNFTVDIANIDNTNATLDWDVNTEQCVDVVQTATYNNASKDLVMDYGTNTLYFEVAAANFVNDFTPQFHLVGGLVNDQTAVVTLYPSLADAQNSTNAAATTNWTAASVGTDWATGIQFEAANSADVVGGVSLFVKVVISNLTEESLTVNPFILAVDARDDANAGQWDMEEDDCVIATATDAADQADEATHNLNPRPTIIMDAVPMAEPSGTTPEDLIVKP